MKTGLISSECDVLSAHITLLQCMIIDRDCNFIRQFRVIGSSKSAHWLSRDERAVEHPSHLRNDKAVIRLSTGHHHIAALRLQESRKKGKDKGLSMALWDYIKVSSLLSCSFSSSPLSFSLIIAPYFFRRRRDTSSHVTLNCSIIFQSLSQPITFAVVPETSVLTRKVGIYARHYVWHLHEARGSNRKIRATALFESFCNRQSCSRDITIQSLFHGYNLVCLLFVY